MKIEKRKEHPAKIDYKNLVAGVVYTFRSNSQMYYVMAAEYESEKKGGDYVGILVDLETGKLFAGNPSEDGWYEPLFNARVTFE